MKKKGLKVVFLMIFLMSSLLSPKVFAENLMNQMESQEQKTSIDIFESITAPNLLLAELNSGKILYERKTDTKIYPASITKLMTAILVVENCNLTDIATVSEKAVTSVPYGYVNAKLQVGEKLTVEELLYAMLVPSANDAANALAEHVGGSIDSFAAMMNTRASELGCMGTNFTNPSGLHQKEHYTTTKDLYLIAQKAYSYDTIRKIIRTTQYTLPSTAKYPKKDRVLTTTNYLIRKEFTKYYYPYCTGAKTGYTGDAKNCVVEFAERDGMKLVAIVMGEAGKVKGKKFLDARQMFEYVFRYYESKVVAKKNDKYETKVISNGTKETRNLDVLYEGNISILQRKDNTNEPQKEVQYTNNKAPIQKGDVIGKITYEHDGIQYSSDLIAASDVEESPILTYALYGGALGVVIVILYILIKSKRKSKSYRISY